MTETEKMRKLHLLAVKGESLTTREKVELQNWYENLDREEDSILNDSHPAFETKQMPEQLTSITE